MAMKYQQRLRRARIRKVAFVLLGLLIVFGVRVTSQDGFLEPIEITPSSSADIQVQAEPEPVMDFLKIVEELDNCRSAGIAARSILEVTKCAASDSPALYQDSEVIKKLLSQGIYVEDLKFEIQEVEFLARRLSQNAEYVSLRVADELMPVQIKSEFGKTRQQPERKSKQWLVVIVKDLLVSTENTWLFWEVSELDSSFD